MRYRPIVSLCLLQLHISQRAVSQEDYSERKKFMANKADGFRRDLEERMDSPWRSSLCLGVTMLVGTKTRC
jgi:hypothetical protein